MTATNRLADETSPYLRQHADNPVDWYPWGPEAFAAATERNVPILLRVGYSACHWCHVMAHECFEDDEVAGEMNRLFVNIKVDREERPDVDSIYMDAVQAMTGRGGWPMTVFLTPRRASRSTAAPTSRSRTSCTSSPRSTTSGVNRPRRRARRTSTRWATRSAGRRRSNQPSDLPGVEAFNQALSAARRIVRPGVGRLRERPEVPVDDEPRPRPAGLHATCRRTTPRTIVTTSLDAMASGGMYDHIGGGFARYSVDREWLVPHFEKMLYDQALLVRVYLHAYLVFGERPLEAGRRGDDRVRAARSAASTRAASSRPRMPTRPTSTATATRACSTRGRRAEVRAVLGADADVALEWYEFTDDGNFEGRTIPARLAHRGDLLRPPEVESARQRLFEARPSAGGPDSTTRS